ncbi:MAG: IS110 family transposase [Candidatus Methanoplasma sp.]|jgi:transposase|nr:IS110 family transposase [Candidatus Methanoplasma sp.]
MRYVGLDVHKKNIAACVISEGGKPVRTMELPDRSGLHEVTEYLDGYEYCVMMESGTYVYDVYRFFCDIGIETHVVHARSLKVITSSDKKTDRRDAETIGRYLRLWKKRELELSMAYMPTREEIRIKDICRMKEEISKKIGDETRRIKSHMARNLEPFPTGNCDLSVKKVRRAVREAYAEDSALMHRIETLEYLRDLNKQLATDIRSMLPGNRDVELLCSIPGIARQSAVQIMSMIVDVNRFEDPEKLCSYFGLVPRVRDSGGKMNHGHMTKKGDRMMRSIMERVTLSHILHCDSSITEYHRKKLPVMGQKKALISSSRKMLAVIYSMLRREEQFRI